jgi:hypothetical protein
MALATVYIKETNGDVGSPVTTPLVNAADTLDNSYLINADSPEVVLSTTYAITAAAAPAGYSYEKWQRLQVYSIGTSSTVSNVKVWCVQTSKPAADTLKVGVTATYATPRNTVSLTATTTMPSTEGTAQAVTKTGAPVSFTTGGADEAHMTDYVVFQCHVDATTAAGPSSAMTMYWQYDEYG